MDALEAAVLPESGSALQEESGFGRRLHILMRQACSHSDHIEYLCFVMMFFVKFSINNVWKLLGLGDKF